MSKLLTVVVRKLIVTLPLVFTATSALAASFAVTIENHPLKRTGPHETCESLFTPMSAFEIVETRLDSEDEGLGGQYRHVSMSRSENIDPLVHRVLDDWVDERDFTREQKEMLWGRDQALDPRRTKYIHLEADGHAAILRIFDGSDEPLFGGSPWKDAALTDSRTPIELGAPGFVLPEHRSHNPIWELSLLNVDRHLRKGVETLLGYVGKQLDLHYNDNEWRIFKSVATLEKRNMVIYAQTRANRVEILKRYGFTPVYAVNSKGEAVPFEVAKNLVLMTFKADEFLKRYHPQEDYVEKKGKSSSAAEEAAKKEREKKRESEGEKMRKHLAELEARRIQIRNMQDVYNEFTEVFKLYVLARTVVGWNDLRQSATVEFFERYYCFINSIPESLRASNWRNLRNAVRELLAQPKPQMALYYFSRGSENDSNRHYTQEDFDLFYSRPTEAFILGTPTAPGMVLSWKPHP